MPEAVLSSEPGACVHLSEVVDQSPRGRGQLRTVRVLAMLPGEPPEAARTVFAVSGRPREELWQIVRRWLDANRARLPEILARCPAR